MQLQTAQRSTRMVVPDCGKPLTDRINIRRGMMKDKSQYTFWGRALKIVFDGDGMERPDPASLDHPVVFPYSITWESDDPWGSPVLALSLNQLDLLIVGDVPTPPEVFGPDRDDTKRWVPTKLPGWQVPRAGDATTAGRMPRRYAQRYSDLTTVFIPRTGESPNFSNPDCFLMIQPIHQIFVKLAGSTQPGLIEPETAADGTKMCFLINPKTREGHLLGGRIRLTTRLHSLPEGAKP